MLPEGPSTAYGYLQKGESLSGGGNRVSSFREKPDHATAIRFLEEGDYLWNAGMFVWRVDRILQEIRLLLPDLYDRLDTLSREVEPSSEDYLSLPSISIDNGIMERSEDVAMVPAGFGWNDIGDWPSARKCGIGSDRVLPLDSDDYTVWNPGRLTVLLGVSGVSIVQTDAVTLVMDDRYSQKLREIVARLEEEEPDLV